MILSTECYVISHCKITLNTHKQKHLASASAEGSPNVDQTQSISIEKNSASEDITPPGLNRRYFY